MNFFSTSVSADVVSDHVLAVTSVTGNGVTPGWLNYSYLYRIRIGFLLVTQCIGWTMIFNLLFGPLLEAFLNTKGRIWDLFFRHLRKINASKRTMKIIQILMMLFFIVFAHVFFVIEEIIYGYDRSGSKKIENQLMLFAFQFRNSNVFFK